MSLKDKAYHALTPKEQETWWFVNAKMILKKYDLPNRSNLKWLGYTHNAVFEFESESKRYMLSMRHLVVNHFEQYEAKLLHQLREDTKLIAPYPIANLDGNYVTEQIDEQLRTLQHIIAIVYEYVEGESVSVEDISTSQVFKVGEYLAHLHQYTQRYDSGMLLGKEEPQYWLMRHSLDYQGLFGKRGMYSLDNEASQVFTDEQIVMMDAVAEKVKRAMMYELGNDYDEYGLIHGDLLLKNILFHEGEVRALDFEYCGWGYYLYDLTPLLWQLKPQARYPELEQALWDGYTSIRPLSSRHRELLETFIAGRQVASMRWVAANRHNPAYQGKVEGILLQRAAELQGFLETGILRRK